MIDKSKEYLQKFADWWKALKKAIKISILVGLALIVVAIGALVIAELNKPYETLFTGLNQADMTAVTTYLADNGITDYQISGQDTVMVLASQEAQIRANLIVQGYPQSGYSHSIYLDNVNALTTESQRNTLYMISLEQEMAEVISHIDGIQDAMVKINPGEDNTYVLDSTNVTKASASVMVTLENGNMLDAGKVEAIRSYVSTAIQGLDMDNISIVDSYGNTYTAADEFGNMDSIATLKFQLEQQESNKIRTNIMYVLEPLFGADNVKVSVYTTVDMNRSVSDSTDYSLEEWAEDGETNGEGIVGSKVYDQQTVAGEEDDFGGVVGTDTNADIPTYTGDSLQFDGSEEQVNNYGEKDFLVDEHNIQTEIPAGSISDVMVSVTVNSEVWGDMDIFAVYPHVARAAGIDIALQEQKIDILVAPFYNDTTDVFTPIDGIEPWLLYVIIGVVVLLIIVVIILVVVGRKRAKRAREEAERLEQERLEAETPAWMEMTEQAKPDSVTSLRDELRNFANENPAIAAQMIKNWLRGSGT